MLSQKARYALHAMIHLARKGEAATVAEIAQAEDIPRKYLEQILSALGTRGLVVGRRGPQGGYRLARGAEAISYADILRCIDGPLALAPCATRKGFRTCDDCQSMETCEIRPVLIECREATARLLEAMTLARAVERGGSLLP
ncbi:RrF2 family transcriptional regulator [Rubellimicrobium roseum]|uniref:Rrf2 family transcriptional regulator n=1 Tax=Rubellimicrobium roseum TaxID=687525 RepID=A0A5C4N761_9RHOB|nr:Rrf2 family transcriptional regulator [Rubellimicrobium roseum]TNC62280.1 Rrf2 family transcriptional regulator [Rubellimicrobium roseum]